MSQPDSPVWLDKKGQPVSCTEKVKVMTENMEELWQVLQDNFEDAILMGCDEEQVRAHYTLMINRLENPYKSNS